MVSGGTKLKEKPADNRIFTGNDAELTHDQARNLMNSPEWKKYQEGLLAKALSGEHEEYARQARMMMERDFAINLLRGSEEGNLMALILDCVFAGYSDKKIAKTLMKADTSRIGVSKLHFRSLTQAIKFVIDKREQAKYIVMKELDKLHLKPVVLAN